MTSPGPVVSPVQTQTKQTPAQGKITPSQLKLTSVQSVHSQPAIPRTSQIVKQVTSVPSLLPIIANAAALALLPVSEFNVWPVLEKLLAATQSMGMLLGSLKDDLKRTSASIAAVSGSSSVEHTRKRREVATKLWRAFVAYKKSFDEIEAFTRGAGTNNVSGSPVNAVATPSSIHKVGNNTKTSAMEASSSHRKELPNKSTPSTIPVAASQTTPAAIAGNRRRPRSVHSNIVIELSDSDKSESGDEESTKNKMIKLEVEVQPVALVRSGSHASSTVTKDNNCVEQQVEMADNLSSSTNNQPKDDQVETVVDVIPENLQNLTAGTENKPHHAGQESIGEDVVVEQVSSGCRQSYETENGVEDSKASSDCAEENSLNDNSKEDCNGGNEATKNDSKSSSPAKNELFSCLRFEPLFEIQPLNGGKS